MQIFHTHGGGESIIKALNGLLHAKPTFWKKPFNFMRGFCFLRKRENQVCASGKKIWPGF